MIQFDKNGTSLIGPNGSVSLFNSDAFGKLMAIRDAQLQTILENTQNQGDYNTKLANAQANVKASGTFIAAPIKPLMKIISDTGVVSYEPFVPALADLVEPAPATDNAVHGLANSGAVLPPDPQAQMFNMISAMFRKMFPDS